MLSDTQIPAPRVAIAGDLPPTREWFRFFNYVYMAISQAAYGAFHDDTNPTFAANTPTLVPLNHTDYTAYMTDGASRINIQMAGLYSITVSSQLTNPNASEDEFYMWLRVNGVDVPASNTVVTVPKKHGSTSGAAVLTVNFFYQFSPGEYFELYGLSKLGYAQITTYPASTSPAYPSVPGTILTVAQVK